MKKTAAALLASVLLLGPMLSQAESLRDIYELALQNDAQLKAEEAQYLARKETENLSRAALLPQVNSSYSYRERDSENQGEARDFNQPGFPIYRALSTTDTTIDGYVLSLNQALFNLPAWFSFKSGKEISKEAEATFAANQQNLIVRVVEAYLLVLRAQDNLTASRAQERAFERQLEQSQQRFEVGLIAITDVYEAQAAFDLSRVNRIVDENNVQVALERLSVLTGQEPGTLNVLKEDLPLNLPDPIDRAAWVDFSLQNNFNLQAARHQEEAARQNAMANRMEHAPKVSGGYEYQNFDTSGSLDVKPDTGFNTSPDGNLEENVLQLRVDMPLYSGGAISAKRRQTAQEYNAARENLINLTRNTVTATRSLHMTVISDVSRVEARKQSIVSSQSAVDATQAGYEVGTRNVVDVLNAQNTLFIAQRDYFNSRYDYIVNMLRLKEQAGTLSPEDIYNFDAYLVPPEPPAAPAATP
ncbi:MAG: TolC family outer membrane protein [Halioglobus sp.]|nr:TolC family outer membrane protein [Halioglobus sp.]